MDVSQRELDCKNSAFWNELCGTVTARRLGITDSSKESLAKFDAWYLDYYPYLLPIVNPQRMRRKKVLEIGLGYGTLGQQIAAAGAEYTGLDIAQNPVDHMNYRLQMHGLTGRAGQGSALAMPFEDAHFEFVVSIGCMHHTGNLQKCIDETYRVLKPGGVAVLMVYNKFSYVRWRQAPFATLAAWTRAITGRGRPASMVDDHQRGEYDQNSQGIAAPEAVVTSVGELKQMLRSFESVRVSKRNTNALRIKGLTLIPRSWLLPTLGRLLGLDLYVEARKPLVDAARVARAA